MLRPGDGKRARFESRCFSRVLFRKRRFSSKQEYIIEGRESILIHLVYSTVYPPFTEVSDLSSVLWFHGLHGNHCGSACVESSCTCSCFVYSHVYT